jgi:hypothetical protein
MTDNNQSHISYVEVVLLINVNLIIVFVGIILWYLIWIKNYGGIIPISQIMNETSISYFNSKNFGIVVTEIWKRFREFNKNYLVRSIGTEGYVFLLFQRKIISLLTTISVISLIISFVNFLANQEKKFDDFHDFLMDNKYLNEFSTAMHLTALIIYTFLHFRFFTVLKNQLKNLYFEHFDKMSRHKDADWLSCRTLHISGLSASQRNSINILIQLIF